jgi:sterol desaturase/sphingolipid hydroxylase (fatty acid hydroxylase superfamily)
MSEMEWTLDGVLNVLSPSLYAFAIAIMALETYFIARLDAPRDKRSRWLGIKSGALAFGAGSLFSATLLVAGQMWFYEHRIFDLGFHWYAWVVCFLVNDLVFYVSHRFEHSVRLWWGVHVVHHSSRHYDLTAGVRGSVLDSLAHWPFYVWIPVLGIHPIIFVILETAFRFYGLAYHTELVGKLGVLEGIIVTPSSHRVHHGSNTKYLDCNFGGFFCFWDRLFGTYVKEDERPTYGLTKDWHSYDVVDCQLHELKDIAKDVKTAPSFKDALKTLFAGPGWRHSNARH